MYVLIYLSGYPALFNIRLGTGYLNNPAISSFVLNNNNPFKQTDKGIIYYIHSAIAHLDVWTDIQTEPNCIAIKISTFFGTAIYGYPVNVGYPVSGQKNICTNSTFRLILYSFRCS